MSEEITTKASKLVYLKWAGLLVGCTLFFTIFSFPVYKIKGSIEGQANAMLRAQGITLSSQSADLSILMGFRYTMERATLHFNKINQSIKFDEVSVRPLIFKSLLSVVGLGAPGASFSLVRGNTEISGSFAGDGQEVDVSFDGEEIDLVKLGVIAALPGMINDPFQIAKSFVGDGHQFVFETSGSFSGNPTKPKELNGDLELDVKRIFLKKQKTGILPDLKISSGKIDIEIGGGKARIKKFELGRDKDSIVGKVTGSAKLVYNRARGFSNSDLDLKADFKFSSPFLEGIGPLKMLLGKFKKGDRYSIPIKGKIANLGRM